MGSREDIHMSELYTKRKILENRIFDLITSFEKETSTIVTNIDIHRVYGIGDMAVSRVTTNISLKENRNG